jgi:hypothetical protein
MRCRDGNRGLPRPALQPTLRSGRDSHFSSAGRAKPADATFCLRGHRHRHLDPSLSCTTLARPWPRGMIQPFSSNDQVRKRFEQGALPPFSPAAPSRVTMPPFVPSSPIVLLEGTMARAYHRDCGCAWWWRSVRDREGDGRGPGGVETHFGGCDARLERRTSRSFVNRPFNCG